MTGFEPLIGAATAGLAGLITSVIKEGGSRLFKKADIDLFKGPAFNRAIQKYVQRYADRHGLLKVACVRMDSPIKLDEIYTAVQLLPRSALRYYESTESLQELFRESGKRGFSFENAEKQQGITVANQQQYLMVLGGPGVGKSTFLRKMGLEALRRHAIVTNAQNNLDALKPQDHYYTHACIPVLLELRQFNSQTLSIKEIIAQEFEICGFPKAQEFTELFLQSGKLLVLLDGLDEVPGDTLNHAVTEIENLVHRYGNNRFIASCRVAAYTFGGFRRFNDVAMAAFEDDQIERFIKNWFRKSRDIETETSKRCWELLSSPDYQAAKELAQTPLLLTLLCVIYDEFQDFPKKRHQVYNEALDVLLRKWASEKRIQRNPIYQELSAELELDLLSEMARSSFVQDQLFFHKQDVIEGIRQFLVSNLNAPTHLDAEKVLKEIEVQQGILVERAQNIYSFSHLTFHEYLTAKWIAENLSIDLEEQRVALTPKRTLLEDLKATTQNLFARKSIGRNPIEISSKASQVNSSIKQVVDSYVLDEKWREVFLLIAGMLPGRKGSDDLLLAMEEKATLFLQKDRLKELLVWAGKKTCNTPGKMSPVAKRISAIALASALSSELVIDYALVLALALNRAHDYELALDLARDLDRDSALARNLACSLARNLNLDLTFSHTRELSYKLGRDLVRERARALARARARARAHAREYLKLGIFKPEKLEALIQEIEWLQSSAYDYKTVLGIFESHIELNEDLLNLSKEESNDLGCYLYVVGLMVHCKDAAVRVSPSVWAGIESRILTVPSN
jgi:hypothetical protein